jgi:predicted nuclease of restriction endonuclease-like (RecB) superfamily
VNKSELAIYSQLLADIKQRVRNAQHRVILSANAEMTLMYWDIGRMIVSRMDREGWGAKVIPRLAVDLRNELPEQKGFSERNIKRMLRFHREYPELQQAVTQKVPQAVAQIAVGPDGELPIVPQAVAQLPSPAEGSETFALIPWGHNMVLMEKVKEPSDRLWYARQTLEHGWSRDTLTANIKSSAHTRQGAAVSNFSKRLPAVHAELASGLLKDPYMFDFFTMEEHFHERELETGLLTHIEKFLLELGRGFAFVGRQYELTVSDREFYLDLLFYHLKLRCFVVVDLKKGEFKPEYAGKMNFYCSAVDDLLRHEHDQPTLGLILCQTKDRIIAEYSLRDIEKPIGVADYELTRALPEKLASSLPSIEAIEAELSQDLAEDES